MFPQKGYIFIHDLAPCHISKITRTLLECNGIPVLKRPGNSPEIHSIENVRNIMKQEIGNQMLCLKEEMWKQVCEAWYSVAPTVLKELYNSIPSRMADPIKQREVQRILIL